MNGIDVIWGSLGIFVTSTVFAFLVSLAILWFILPFSIFGVKGKLDKIVAGIDKNTYELRLIQKALKTVSHRNETGAE